MILLVIILFTFFSRPVYSLIRVDENWGYLGLASHYKYSAWDRSKDYEKFIEQLNFYDCIEVKSKNPFVKKIFGKRDKENFFTVPYLFLNKKIDVNNWYLDNSLFKKSKNSKCANKITIKENGIVFN